MKRKKHTLSVLTFPAGMVITRVSNKKTNKNAICTCKNVAHQ